MSTLLTLVVVPVVYTLIDDAIETLRGRRHVAREVEATPPRSAASA